LALGTNSQISGRSHWNVAAGAFVCPTTIPELSGSHPNGPDWLPFKSALTAELEEALIRELEQFLGRIKGTMVHSVVFVLENR
jgi:hypothetical protein